MLRGVGGPVGRMRGGRSGSVHGRRGVGVLFVVVLLVGLYVAPDLVYPEEQVGGVSGSFYVNYESRLLAQAVLFGVASVLFLFFLGGLWAFLARAEGQEPRLAPVVLAAGAVFTGLGLLQAATLTALVALRGNELGVRAQGSGWAARALFYLEGAIGDMALFPFAVFLAAAAMVVVRTRVLPGWLGWIGAVLGLSLVCWRLGRSSDWISNRRTRRSWCWRWSGWRRSPSVLTGCCRRRPGGPARRWTKRSRCSIGLSAPELPSMRAGLRPAASASSWVTGGIYSLGPAEPL